MYVRDTDPLPQNSEVPSSDCYNWGVCLQNTMAESIANAQAASASIAGPDSFYSFGPGVVTDVARAQNSMAVANLGQNVVDPYQEVLAAPQVFPLNVTPEEYGACNFRSGVILPTVIPKQTITMPAAAPQPVVLPPVATAPNYSNLCWALRNGALDQSQFDPAEYQALQWRCTQLGYAGACLPPPAVALWLTQQRRAGTLPHIAVSQAQIDAIPQAPDITSTPMSCPDSWKLGGMAGYRRGMGALWGDAGSVPSSAGWDTPASSSGWKAILFFGAIGVGLYMMAEKNGRG